MEQTTTPSETSELLTTDQVANLYKQFTANALRIQRYRGESPFPYIKLGKKIFYNKADIERVLNNHTVDEYETHSNQR
jgi:hypothetical protein